MNVIFLDFDGVLFTAHSSKKEDVERRVQVLSNICNTYNCKVVIGASNKESIDEETMETESKWLKDVLNLFKKYNIDCIGRTPNVSRNIGDGTYISTWKEDEIRLYLFRHPEIDHYCVIDDDDFIDLKKVQNHLIKTIDYSPENPYEEGLLLKYKEEVGRVLEKDNHIKKLSLKRKSI